MARAWEERFAGGMGGARGVLELARLGEAGAVQSGLSGQWTVDSGQDSGKEKKNGGVGVWLLVVDRQRTGGGDRRGPQRCQLCLVACALCSVQSQDEQRKIRPAWRVDGIGDIVLYFFLFLSVPRLVDSAAWRMMAAKQFEYGMGYGACRRAQQQDQGAVEEIPETGRTGQDRGCVSFFSDGVYPWRRGRFSRLLVGWPWWLAMGGGEVGRGGEETRNQVDKRRQKDRRKKENKETRKVEISVSNVFNHGCFRRIRWLW